MKEKNTNEIIENYLNGELSGEQLKEVEDRINVDEDFAKEVEWQREAKKLMEDEGMRVFQQKLQAYKKERTKANIVEMKPQRKYLRIAAAVALVIAAVFLFLSRGPDGEKLYTQYYKAQKDEISNQLGFAAGQKFDDLQRIMEGYGSPPYDDTVDSLRSHYERYEDDIARYYIAHTYIAQDDLKMAQGEFEKIIPNDPFMIIDDTYWYLALIHIKNNDFEIAKEYLNKISEDYRYKKEVTSLLDEIQ